MPLDTWEENSALEIGTLCLRLPHPVGRQRAHHEQKDDPRTVSSPLLTKAANQAISTTPTASRSVATVGVRTLLYGAASVLLTRYKCPLKPKDWAFALARRSTMRKAIALARRLAIHHACHAATWHRV